MAAGGLGELGHHAGQGPVLCLQPLLNLPQSLNLLYLGEVLQENHNTGRDRDREKEKGNVKSGVYQERERKSQMGQYK